MSVATEVTITDEKSDDKEEVKAKIKSRRSSKYRGNPSPCPICGVIICNSYNLSCHIRRHKNDKPFKCDQCPAAFILITELRRHKVTHSKDRPFKCNMCPKSFKCIEILRIHLDSHGLNEYKCRYCELKFKNYKSRGSHEINFHTISNLKCKYCYKSFSEVKFREQHESLVHNKKIDSELQKKVVMNVDSIKREEGENGIVESIETDIKKIERTIKKRKPRTTKYSEEKVLRLDSNFKFYACKFCPERFRYRKDQITHYQEFHKEEYDKVFKVCKICGKLLTEKHFASHMQAHSGILPYKCNVCEYKSARKNDLSNHMLVHTKEYRYKCSHCQKPFRNIGPALLCEKKHTGKKDVKCNMCEMTFFSGLDLRSHVISKHKNRRCSLCSFETTDRYLYDRHKLKHRKSGTSTSDAKKIMCDKCGALFKSIGYLTTHLKKHNNMNNSMGDMKVHFCSYCDFKGASYSDVLNHCNDMHPSQVKRCGFCTYTSLNKNHFINHMRNHVSNSAEDMYLCTNLNKCDKDTKSLYLECFVCGFSSSSIEIMDDHIEVHNNTLKPFKWYSSDFYYHRVKRNGTKSAQKKDSSDIEHYVNDAQSTNILQITNISLPVDVGGIPTDMSGDSASETAIKEEMDENDGHNTSDPDFGRYVTETIYVNEFDSPVKSEGIEPSITLEDMDDNDSFERDNLPEKVTIKIRKLKHKTVSNSKSSSRSKLKKTKAGLNLNLNSLKTKFQNINGKLFLSLEDLCSVSNVSKESLMNIKDEKM